MGCNPTVVGPTTCTLARYAGHRSAGGWRAGRGEWRDPSRGPRPNRPGPDARRSTGRRGPSGSCSARTRDDRARIPVGGRAGARQDSHCGSDPRFSGHPECFLSGRPAAVRLRYRPFLSRAAGRGVYCTRLETHGAISMPLSDVVRSHRDEPRAARATRFTIQRRRITPPVPILGRRKFSSVDIRA